MQTALTRIGNKSMSSFSVILLNVSIDRRSSLHSLRSVLNEKNVLSDSLLNLFPCFSYKSFDLRFPFSSEKKLLRFRLNVQFIETFFARNKTFNSKLAVDYLSALVSREFSVAFTRNVSRLNIEESRALPRRKLLDLERNI